MEKLLFIIIISAAILLRGIYIDQNPPALYGDELTMVYDSYSLLKTSRDQTGTFLPLTFSMRGGTPAGYTYFSIPFVYLFGPTALGVRILSVLSGVGFVIAIYFLGKFWFDKKTALIAMALAAISPWSIAISRGGFESNFALFLAFVSITCYVYAKSKPFLLIFSILLASLSLHTYQTYRLVLPLIFIVLLLTSQQSIKYFVKSRLALVVVAVLIAVIIGGSAYFQTIFFGSESRFFSQNIFGQQHIQEQVVQKVNHERNLSILPAGLLPFFHNKYIEYGKNFGMAYFRHFSFDFLFAKGDQNPRHNMAEFGGFYLVEIITILIGLTYLWLKSPKIFGVLLSWILLSPLPSAMMGEPHFLRASFLLPPLIILSSVGILKLLEFKIQDKMRVLLITLIIVLIIIQFGFLAEKGLFIAPVKNSSFWSTDAKTISNLATQEKSKFKYILLSDRIDNIEYAYPVYNLIEPQQIIEQNLARTPLQEWYFKKLDNVYIGYIPQSRIESFINELPGSVLYIGPIDDKSYVTSYVVQWSIDQTNNYLIKKKI